MAESQRKQKNNRGIFRTLCICRN